MKFRDWLGQTYEVEIERVRFLGGFVIWIDGEPYNEGESFPSFAAARKELSKRFTRDEDLPRKALPPRT